MTDVKQIFSDLSPFPGFRRVDAQHLLDLYYGFDNQGRATLLLICAKQPEDVYSSRLIDVTIGRRNDGKWALSFALQQQEFKDLFYSFCTDIVESSRGLKHEECGSTFVEQRYRDWQQMLAQVHIPSMSQSGIKGLAGELLFLRDFMIPHYGCQRALDAWIGPLHGDQDFVTAGPWYEIKSTSTGAEGLHISSVEQLDCAKPGFLVVQYLDVTGADNPDGVTLNSLYKNITALLETDVQHKQFLSCLWQQGFSIQPVYDRTVFLPGKRRYFRVDSDFPCIRHCSLPQGVSELKYVLSLASIVPFEKESAYGC